MDGSDFTFGTTAKRKRWIEKDFRNNFTEWERTEGFFSPFSLRIVEKMKSIFFFVNPFLSTVVNTIQYSTVYILYKQQHEYKYKLKGRVKCTVQEIPLSYIRREC